MLEKLKSGALQLEDSDSESSSSSDAPSAPKVSSSVKNSTTPSSSAVTSDVSNAAKTKNRNKRPASPVTADSPTPSQPVSGPSTRPLAGRRFGTQVDVNTPTPQSQIQSTATPGPVPKPSTFALSRKRNQILALTSNSLHLILSPQHHLQLLPLHRLLDPTDRNIQSLLAPNMPDVLPPLVNSPVFRLLSPKPTEPRVTTGFSPSPVCPVDERPSVKVRRHPSDRQPSEQQARTSSIHRKRTSFAPWSSQSWL